MTVVLNWQSGQARTGAALTLTRLPGRDLLVKLAGAILRNRQRMPLRTSEVLRKQHNLSHMFA